MIQEVVASIIEAEDKAKQIIANSEEQASAIAQDALKTVRLLQSEASQSRKDISSKATMLAHSKAKLESDKAIADGKATVDEQLEQYNSNSAKAVAYVMEQIL